VSQATQVKLLRVLDTSTFRHVGGTAEIRVDARVVVATNRDLATLARQRLFREDLYYRLGTITVELPPLRQRPGDVELLAEHFVARFNGRYESSRRLAPEAMALLRRYEWPGNVRELLHVIESAAVVCEGSEILPHHLPAPLRAPVVPSPPAAEAVEPLPTLREAERAHIERALRSTGGHRGNAARMLGISERNLYRKLEEYRLS
jgi:DNA-binding NtrC family response regulator